MKTKNWIAHPRSKSKKELGDQVTGRWKVNVFFLLLVSSQSLILPWLPAILQASGLRGLGIGLVMAFITLGSVLSVKIVLIFITATKSGAVRRFTLLFLLGAACVMYVFAIAALPFEKSYDRCSSSSGHTDEKNTTVSPSTYSVSVGSSAHPLSGNFSDSSEAVASPPPSSTKRPPDVEVSDNDSKANVTANKSTTKPTTSKTTTTTPKTTTTSTTTTTAPPTIKSAISVNSTTLGTSINQLSSDVDNFHGNTTDSLISDEKDSPESSSDEELNHSGVYEESDLTTSSHKNQGESLSLAGLKPLSNTGNNPWFSSKPHLSRVTGLKPQLSGHSSLGRMGSKQANLRGPLPFTGDSFDNNLPLEIYDPSYQQQGMQVDKLRSSYYDMLDESRQYDKKHYIVKRHSKHKQNINDEKDNDDPQSLVKDLDLEQKLHKELSDGESFDLDSEKIEKLKKILLEAEAKTPSTESPAHVNESGPWIWVSILLVSASLMAGGIEAGVTRLWHCYSHCYHLFHNRPRQDINSDDLLERTLTDTFELSANGEHHGWTRIISGCVIIVSSVLLAFGCQIGLPPGWSLVGQAGVFTVVAAFTLTVLLLLLPVPWGSIKPPKMARPLSLYLDDEVLWEGLRRIACPLGTAVHGLLSSLPSVYVVLLLTSRAEDSRFGSALSVFGVSFSLLGEGFTMCCRRKLTSVLDSPGLVGLSLGGLAVQLMLAYFVVQETAQWLVAASWVMLGSGHALILMSVRQNALMLATIRDQEREAWVSWVSGRVGTAVGSFLWPFIAWLKWSSVSYMNFLLMPAAVTSAVLAGSVAALAALTRSRRAARRRVYHTLDLHSTADADDEDSDEEEDWLVRGARKEGMLL